MSDTYSPGRIRSMSARAAAVGIGAVAAAAVLAAPAAASPVDDAFLATLSNAGLNFTNPVNAVDVGKSVCPMLVGPGKSFAKAIATVQNKGVPPTMAAFFAGMAIQAYCPSMIASIGNGTLLNWLQQSNVFNR